MRLLLDTHVLLWWLDDNPALSDEARAGITRGENHVAVSAVTAWEISIKQALGKLVAPDDLEDQMDANGFDPLPITVADGLAAGNLPRHHDDPFARMLVAQAQARHLTVVTRDPSFALYGVAVLPA